MRWVRPLLSFLLQLYTCYTKPNSGRDRSYNPIRTVNSKRH